MLTLFNKESSFFMLFVQQSNLFRFEYPDQKDWATSLEYKYDSSSSSTKLGLSPSHRLIYILLHVIQLLWIRLLPYRRAHWCRYWSFSPLQLVSYSVWAWLVQLYFSNSCGIKKNFNSNQPCRTRRKLLPIIGTCDSFENHSSQKLDIFLSKIWRLVATFYQGIKSSSLLYL